jgi:hypothetical protein
MSISFFLVTFFYAFILIYISTRLSRIGSDNHFYIFYIQAIRNNGHRMIKSFDRFLNKAEPTDPQFFFWLLSWFPDSAIRYVAILLNSTLSVLLGISFYIALQHTNLVAYTEIVYTAFLFTPIYFFGSNSRLYGLSARGFGLLLFFLLSWSVYNLELKGFDIGWFVAALAFGFLIWGSNLFAQQAFVGFGLFLLVQGYIWMSILLVSSTLIFLIVCREYAVRFFKNRYQYLLIYKNILAKKIILQNRESVWGDFIDGFWKKSDRSLGSRLYYILSNPVLQGLIYLPLLPVILFERSRTGDSFFTSTILSAVQVRVFSAFIGAGILCFLITSFRGSRFLGEPERYLEIINPFILLVGITVLFKWGGNKALIIYAGGVSVFTVSQILLFIKGISATQNSISSDTKSIVNAIKQHAQGGDVRLFSNNQDWMKFYLPHNFRMVYYYPTQKKIADIHLDEIMPKFSIIHENYIERVISHYNINYCVIDKNYVFTSVPGKEVIYEDQASFVVYRQKN